MPFNPDTRIQALGKELPKARKLFRRLGLEIDASDTTLAQACETAGISFKDFTRTLQAMTPEVGSVRTIEDWDHAPLEDLIHHIQLLAPTTWFATDASGQLSAFLQKDAAIAYAGANHGRVLDFAGARAVARVSL